MADLTILVDGAPVDVRLGENTEDAAASAAAAAASEAGAEAAADRAEDAADQAQAALPYYSTVSAGAAATSAPNTFLSDESGAMAVYDEAGTLLYGIVPRSLLPTFVDAHGAAGDGTTIDTAAIQAAVIAAGTGGTIRFTSGKTYVIDGMITLLAGQTVDYNGATIKRAPQAKTTLTAAFNAASGQVLTVDDTSDFRVGSAITITLASTRSGVTLGDGSNNPYAAETQTHKITAKTSTTLTVTGSFWADATLTAAGFTEYPIGAEVVSAYIIWDTGLSATGVTIHGPGTHDGGTTAHDSAASGSTANGWQVRGRRWETTAEVHIFGDQSTVRDLKFVDCPSDAVIWGGQGSVLERLYFHNIGGNSTHCTGELDGSDGDQRGDKLFTYGANRVWIEHDGLDASDVPAYCTVGHENGAYASSQGCQFVTYTDILAEDALCLFSPMYNSLSDRATVVRPTGRNLIVAFHTQTFDTQGVDVIVKGGRFYDCGTSRIGRSKVSADFTETQVRMSLLDCEFINSRLALDDVAQFKMVGGRIRHDNPATTDVVISISGGSDIEIMTEIDGAQRGIYASGTIDGLKISCKWRRIHEYGARLSDLNTASRRIFVVGNDVNIADYRDDDGDTSTTAPSTTVTFCLIDMGVAEDNRIRMTSGRAAFEVLTGTAIVRRNHIETNTVTTTRPVLIWTGTGSQVYDNTITVAIRDDVGRSASAGSAVSASGGTPGNGAVGSLTADALSLTGVYQVVIVAAATDGGTFQVFRPDGVLDGLGVVGTAYNGMINFTLADGSTDFVVGDRIPITVTGNVIENNRTFTYAA